jgi:NADPH:quinone reductase-like Zn-dependent oxidoreductase
VLVNGAGSGVSCALLALLRAGNATVITTAGGPTKVARALAVGYDRAIDYRSEDVETAVQTFTAGRGVDLVIDHVGPALFCESVRSLAIGGRMVFCGTTTGVEANLALTDVYHWGRTLIGAGGYHAADFPVMLDAFAAVEQRPVIDSVWSFDDLATAQRRMADGDFFGKIVVDFAR